MSRTGRSEKCHVVALTVLSLLIASISGILIIEKAEGAEKQLGYFNGREIYNTSRVLGAGVGVGDVDGDGDQEISICDFQGNVLLLDRQDGEFESSTIWTEPGPPAMSKTLNEIKVADILLDKPGPEILVGGNSRNLTVLYYEEGWRSRVIYESPVQIWSMGIGDFDPESRGEEIFLTSFDEARNDRILRYLKRGPGNLWMDEDIEMPHTTKAVDIVDADPSVPGKEAWVTTSLQTTDPVGGGEYTISLLLEVFKEGGEWTYREVDSNIGKLIANIKGGDIWSAHPGNELITVDFNGNCTVYWEEGGEFEKEIVFKATDDIGNYALLEGLAVGEFNPQNEGREALVTGYYNDVTQIVESDGNITADLAWERKLEDPNLEISGINVGDVLPDHPGNEIIVGSRQGWVVVVNYERDGFDLEVDETSFQMYEGTNKELTATIFPRGYLRGNARISTEGDVDFWVTAPANVEIEDHDPVDFKMTITANEIDSTSETYNFDLVVNMGEVERRVGIEVTILGQDIDTTMDIEPSAGILYKEMGHSFSSKVTFEGWGDMDSLSLDVENPPYLMVTHDDPVPKGGYGMVRITPHDNATEGEVRLTVDAVYSGKLVATGEIRLNIFSLQSYFRADLREGEENHYFTDIKFTGPASINNLTVVVKVDGEVVSRNPEDFQVGETVEYKFTSSGDVQGDVTVEILNPAQQIIATLESGEVEYVEEDEDNLLRNLFIGLVIILVIVMLLVAFFYKPGEKDKDESLIGIGSPSRYHPESGMGRERRPRGRAEPDRRRGGPSRRGPDRGRRSPRDMRGPERSRPGRRSPRDSGSPPVRGGSLRDRSAGGRDKRAPPPRFR